MSTGRTVVDLRAVKPVGSVLGDALRCYRAYPWLFAALTLAVVVPYALIVWLVNHHSLITTGSHGAVGTLTALLLPVLIVQPLISALHVSALVEIGAGRVPALVEVLLRGVRVLPVVAAAEVVSSLGIALGLLLLIVPGILLLARWSVVAQAAAIERVNWLDALKRSGELTNGNYLHVLAVVLSVGIINTVIERTVATAVRHGASIVQIMVGILVQTILLSFAALTIAMLYYDLTAREAR